MADSNLPYFLLGIGVGATLGLLYAPQAGEDTRRELRSRADEGRDYMRRRTGEGRDYVRRRGDELRHQAEDMLDRGRGAVQTQRDQLARALDAGRRAYRDATGYEPMAGEGSPQ